MCKQQYQCGHAGNQSDLEQSKLLTLCSIQSIMQCIRVPDTCYVSTLPAACFAFTQPGQYTVHVQIHTVRVAVFQQINMFSPTFLLKDVQQIRHFFLRCTNKFPYLSSLHCESKCKTGHNALGKQCTELVSKWITTDAWPHTD